MVRIGPIMSTLPYISILTLVKSIRVQEGLQNNRAMVNANYDIQIARERHVQIAFRFPFRVIMEKITIIPITQMSNIKTCTRLR